MRSSQPLLLLFFLSTPLLFHSCVSEDELTSIPDPKEVVDVPGFDGNGAVTPSKILTSGKIIGYVGGGLPHSWSINYDLDAKGFIINSDGTGYLSLMQPGDQSNWPFDINDDEVIVGTYLPEGNYTTAYLPAYAYVFDLKSGFKDIHPANASYSIAQHITNSGIILGEYGMPGTGSIACIFSGGTVLNLIDPKLFKDSKVQCANDEIAIVYGFNGNSRSFYKYTFATSQLTKLNGNYSTYTEFRSINDNGLAVGFTDEQGRDVGLIYNTNTDERIIYNSENNKSGYTYDGHGFFDINNSGKIVGRSFRPVSGWAQSRAIRIASDFLGWSDVTPGSSEAYSEMKSINENGIAVGSMGISKEQGNVVNKLFVMDVN